MPCKECVERGKTWSGNNPVCAFENKEFGQENWMCASMNFLRDLCREHGYTRRDDMAAASIGVLHIPENDIVNGYLVMTWYKERGRTGTAVVMCDSMSPEILNKEMAEEVIRLYKERT